MQIIHYMHGLIYMTYEITFLNATKLKAEFKCGEFVFNWFFWEIWWKFLLLIIFRILTKNCN
jgi:hypothetical protein